MSGDEARFVDVVRAALQLGHQLRLPSAQRRGRRGARDPGCHLARWWRNCVLGFVKLFGETPSFGLARLFLSGLVSFLIFVIQSIGRGGDWRKVDDRLLIRPDLGLYRRVWVKTRL